MTRTNISLFAAAALLSAGTLQAATPREPEAQLAKMLEGRSAGEPVKCINLSRVRSSKIIDDTAIVYDTGSTLYVNRPDSGRQSLDQWDILVTKTHSSELCSVDTVQLYDASARMQTGVVFLGEFVPYKRDRKRTD